MPTSTWRRLPEPRRTAVVVAAEAEFASKGFARGSLNVIARTAGVAKGSLFVYFHDKIDLFGHIVELAATRVGEAIDRRSEELAWADGFFPALTELLDEWMQYFRTHPVDRSLTVRTILELDPNARAKVTNNLDRSYVAFLRPLLDNAQKQGWLSPDADLDAFVSLLVLLLPHLADSGLRAVDPIFAPPGRLATEASVAGDRAGVRRLVRVFEVAFGSH